MGSHLTRREFVGAASALGAAGLLAPSAARAAGAMGRPPVVIASANGLATVARASKLMTDGMDPLESVVEGVGIVEDDPNDMTVGLGGLPNEDGVVELDASVMHGPRHRAGAVASLRNIRNPSKVALEVARRTDHVLLVGEGALRFAKRLGFQEQNLLTEDARRAWLRWRSGLNPNDDWLEKDEFDLPLRPDPERSAFEPTGRRGNEPHHDPAAVAVLDDVVWIDGVPHTSGTIHCSGLNADGDLAGVTTTSGLSWKLPGRVGDSPIIGAGLYTENEVGSAGATGRGEAVIQVCGARLAVMRMEQGDHPTDACLHVLRHIASRTRSVRLLNRRGAPNFNVVMYAVRKDGAYGSASMIKGRQFAVSEHGTARLEDSAFLFENS